MIFVVIIFVLVALWAEKPSAGPLDATEHQLSTALAQAPNRVLRASGLVTEGDPSEFTVTHVPDPSSNAGWLQ